MLNKAAGLFLYSYSPAQPCSYRSNCSLHLSFQLAVFVSSRLFFFPSSRLPGYTTLSILINSSAFTIFNRYPTLAKPRLRSRVQHYPQSFFLSPKATTCHSNLPSFQLPVFLSTFAPRSTPSQSGVPDYYLLTSNY